MEQENKNVIPDNSNNVIDANIFNQELSSNNSINSEDNNLNNSLNSGNSFIPDPSVNNISGFETDMNIPNVELELQKNNINNPVNNELNLQEMANLNKPEVNNDVNKSIFSSQQQANEINELENSTSPFSGFTVNNNVPVEQVNDSSILNQDVNTFENSTSTFNEVNVNNNVPVEPSNENILNQQSEIVNSQNINQETNQDEDMASDEEIKKFFKDFVIVAIIVIIIIIALPYINKLIGF